jgi:signal transduction histidine kinase
MTRFWPRSLFMRLVLAWCGALIAAHLLNLAIGFLHLTAYQGTRTSYYLSKDLQLLVPALQASGTAARAEWIGKMARKDYDYLLETGAPPTSAVEAARNLELAQAIYGALGERYPATISAGRSPDEEVRVHLRLDAGSVLTVRVFRSSAIMSPWGAVILVLQALAVLLLTWLAVRQATRPLASLAKAAEKLGSSMECEPIAEEGPVEVARAAAAFNLMGRRIKDHLAERVRILAAIAHDLQTPITRMRLRADLLDDRQARNKFQQDLDAMQALVEEGIGFARSAGNVVEPACDVDLGALFDAMVCEYEDAGHAVRLTGDWRLVIRTRPHTLRRIVLNLTDNALKFAADVEIHIARLDTDRLSIRILDRGPGIPEQELAAVFQPFYRVEASRNRGTGGTGLGLAIAEQLSTALEAHLSLRNRDGGGLEARLDLPLTGRGRHAVPVGEH